MEISLGRVLEAARERRATLTAEVAGYVILLAARQLAAEPFQVSAHSVILDEGGDVFVERSSAASELDIETVLRGLLRALMSVCSSPPPAIAAVAARHPSGDLLGLVAELSAALIPINHSAAHRALARLHRETRRAGLPAIAQPAVDAAPALGAEPAELDIDVLVEAEVTARDHLAPELPPGDPLPPEVPTRHPRVQFAAADEPRISHDGVANSEPAERLVLPAARPRWNDTRSDVQQLLAAFLAETRPVEPMLRMLREMIALDVRPPRDGAGEASSSPAPH